MVGPVRMGPLSRGEGTGAGRVRSWEEVKEKPRIARAGTEGCLAGHIDGRKDGLQEAEMGS